MSMQQNSIFALTLISSAALTANRFITPAGAAAGAGANTLGVNRQTVTASGQAVTVDVIGTAIVEAGAAVSQFATVQSDATGRAITYSSGARTGIALQAASTAGNFIEVLLLQNAA
jgi:hypothetical protein